MARSHFPHKMGERRLTLPARIYDPIIISAMQSCSSHHEFQWILAPLSCLTENYWPTRPNLPHWQGSSALESLLVLPLYNQLPVPTPHSPTNSDLLQPILRQYLVLLAATVALWLQDGQFSKDGHGIHGGSIFGLPVVDALSFRC